MLRRMRVFIIYTKHERKSKKEEPQLRVCVSGFSICKELEKKMLLQKSDADLNPQKVGSEGESS